MRLYLSALQFSLFVLLSGLPALAHAQQGTAANLDNPLCHVSMAIAAHRLGDPAMARRSIDFLKGRTAFVSTDKVAEHLPQVQPGLEIALEDMVVRPVAGAFNGILHDTDLIAHYDSWLM